MFSCDIIFRPKYISTNPKWAVTAAARSVHCPKVADGSSFIDLCLSPTPTVLLLHILLSFQFWHPMKLIHLDPWRLMEVCGKGLPLWAHTTISRGCHTDREGVANFRMTSFWKPHFKRLFLADLWGWQQDCGLRQNPGYDIHSRGNHNTEQHSYSSSWEILK